MPANRYYTGPASDHFDGTEFFNPSGTKPKGVRELLRWQLRTPKAKWPKAFPSPHANVPPAHAGGDDIRISFIGHASYLIQAHGRSILIDPVYAQRCGPFNILGPQRVNPPGIAFASLPKIDAVIVTHNHYDHMDMGALAQLAKRDMPQIITPLGNDAIMKRKLGNVPMRALDWHRHVTLAERFEIHAVPTQHWSARGARDRCHALWASFVLKIGTKTIYAVGDSGLGDGHIFRNVGQRFPNIDMALLPIGAYEPRWFMRDQHMNPDDAVQAFEFCGARRAVGHHWGTFQLTNEAIDAPRTALAAALAARNIPAEKFIALQPGAVHTV
jgi:L-ascorbate metabolism protein UlaG (beta-lactamase superfamily)